MGIRGIGFFLVCTLLAVISLTEIASSGPVSISGELELPAEVPVFIKGANDTLIEVEGQFRVVDKSGIDYLQELTATLSIGGGDWEADIPVSTFSDVQTGEIYLFIVRITIPPEADDGQRSSYTVTLVLSNQLNTAQDQSGFTVSVDKEDTNDDDGKGTFGLPSDSSIPLLPMLFIGAVLVFLAVAGIWVSMNIEIVREVGGMKRIFFREKGSGRILGRRKAPPLS